jgi:ribosomal protein S12 methylthiotransferase accessory factor
MLYSSRQYRDREKWNAYGSAFNMIPHEFDKEAEINWSPVWSMITRDFRYLPSAYLLYGYPSEHAKTFCWANSNGTAAGSTFEESVLEGFFEVVERDSVAMWWYNRTIMPAVDLESFRDPFVGKCIEYYRTQGRVIWSLDLTNDFGIPTFVALSRRIDQSFEEITFGFGSHLDADLAIKRALLEMSQFLPAVSGPIQSDGKRVYAYPDKHAIEWWRTASVANQPYLLPRGDVKPRARSYYLQYDSDDQLVDLMNCVVRTQELGMDFLVYDYSQPDIDLRVSKVVIPGARHFWARFAPGRLYDVPKGLGWIAGVNSEEALNPIPFFL